MPPFLTFNGKNYYQIRTLSHFNDLPWHTYTHTQNKSYLLTSHSFHYNKFHSCVYCVTSQIFVRQQQIISLDQLVAHIRKKISRFSFWIIPLILSYLPPPRAYKGSGKENRLSKLQYRKVFEIADRREISVLTGINDRKYEFLSQWKTCQLYIHLTIFILIYALKTQSQISFVYSVVC